jgi:4-amino-4-deoxy-L-arabinose transferase-like glycosyltransferase
VDRWHKDFSLWWALLIGAFVRVLPLAMWQTDKCMRDECTYMSLANRLADGEGMNPSNNWIWAPGYPSLMALHERLFGHPEAIVGTQIVLFSVAIVLGYQLAKDAGGLRAGRITAWLLACSPTLAFFAGHIWSESIYTTLLIAAVFSLGWARKGSIWRALLPGVLVGGCVLFRGVATYMVPIFALAMLWQRWRDKSAWGGAALLVLAGVMVVAPYSIYASQKFGGLVISDATMGQMMWLGNNLYEPITFDWGVGTLNTLKYNALLDTGRPHCSGKEYYGKAWDACEMEAAKEWIKANPGEFIRRIPQRWAQLFNPNSFVTRHVRLDRWAELPPWVTEPMLIATIVLSYIAVLGGIIGAFAKGRGWLMMTTLLIVGYHVAAIGLVAGLSRYRVPLDALFLVWAGVFLADPKRALDQVGQGGWRFWCMSALLLICTPLMTWYLLPGYLPK